MIYTELKNKKKILSVTGLGYVGLPLALSFAKHFKVIGFDINPSRVEMMKNHIDPSNELDQEDFKNCDIIFTRNPDDLKNAHFHIVSVPTDVDQNNLPNLGPLLDASKFIGNVLKQGDYVVYESTVYPGCTEEDCVPILESQSRLKSGVDFKYGYSPERIVPGSKQQTLSSISKIVSACDPESLEIISHVYQLILDNEPYKAPSIKVAEAAKVIENTQRDLNISLMNELSIILDKMDINTHEVIEAASTKWNFHKYYPGLVGGHCINVDPYYLIHKAQQLGYDPQVIAAGRRVNNYIPTYVAKKLVQFLIEQGKLINECSILIQGITFKEDVSDIRNSKVAVLVNELLEYSLKVDVMDPFASPEQVLKQYAINLKNETEGKYDAIVVAVGHEKFKTQSKQDFKKLSKGKIVLVDIKGIYNSEYADLYWSL